MAGSSEKNSRRARAWAGLTLAVTVIALFIGGSQPFAVGLIPAPWDKLAHGALFAAFAAGIGVASGMRGSRMALWAVAGALLLGLLDEMHQQRLPGRHAGLDDLAADALGALAGAAVLMLRQRARER